MSVSIIANALKNSIQPFITNYSIVRINDMSPNKFFIRMTELPMQPNILTIGRSRITKHQGQIQFDCVMPIGTGDTEAQTLINTILTKSTFGVYVADGFKFEIVQSYEMPGHLAPRSTTPDKYIRTVCVEYSFFG